MNIKKFFSVMLKGCAMGAADVIPGVSGGTIAFISGIYEELLGSIKSIDFAALKLLGRFRLKEFWTKVNGNFLLAVVLGVGISIVSFARLMTWMLETQPIATWSFFFGLIIASSILVSKQITKWNILTVVAIAAGVVAAYFITVMTPTSTPETWWFIMLSGAIAICAMILPGISGAFLLLLLGKYQFMMTAVAEVNIPVIILFGVGALVGIVSFSHILSWLLKNYHNATVALLTGFMVGSLNKVWPWKKVLETYTDSHGAVQPLVQANVLPTTFETISGTSSQLGLAVVMCVTGFLLITVIEIIGKRMGKKA